MASGEGDSLGCNKGGEVMGGFRGAPYIGLPFNPRCEHRPDNTCLDLDSSHLAMTYTALACLAILGFVENLEREESRERDQSQEIGNWILFLCLSLTLLIGG